MLDFFTTPILSYIVSISPYEAIGWSCIWSTGICLPFWIIAGVQDWKHHEVSGWVCLCIFITLFSHALFMSGIFNAMFVALLAYFTFREKELKYFGQADFAIFAHWWTAYFCYHEGFMQVFCVSLVFLLTLGVYILIYKDENGERWHHGKMMPMIPPYAVTCVICAVARYPIAIRFFYQGW